MTRARNNADWPSLKSMPANHWAPGFMEDMFWEPSPGVTPTHCRRTDQSWDETFFPQYKVSNIGVIQTEKQTYIKCRVWWCLQSGNTHITTIKMKTWNVFGISFQVHFRLDQPHLSRSQGTRRRANPRSSVLRMAKWSPVLVIQVNAVFHVINTELFGFARNSSRSENYSH